MLTQYQLKNKMKVLLVESHKAPVVSVQVWVKTGSADEKRGEEGLSHFIEHLVFKGTQKYGVGEIAKTVEGSGGELNAYTTFDHTVFHVTMASRDLEVGLDVLSQMMGFPKFDPVEINREREVVLEEIKRSFDNPHQVASQQIFSTVFKKHPYGIPIIGFEKNIKNVSPKKIYEYYFSRYVPSNMTLVVAGDFDKAKIKKQVEEFYAGFKKKKLKKIKRAKEAKQKNFNYNYKAGEFKEAILNIAFKVPGAKHKDVVALDVLGLVLGGGDSSRLMQKLRLQKPLVTSVGSGSYNPLDDGLFMVNAAFQMENFREIIEILAIELKKIKTEFVSAEEIQRAKLNIESDEVYGLETVNGLARKVGIFQILLNDPNHIQKYLKRLQELTAQDLMTAAQKYLQPKRMSISLLLNKEYKFSFSQKHFFDEALKFKNYLGEAKSKKLKLKEKNKKAQPKIKIPLALAPAKHNIQKLQLPSGAQLILKNNPELPVVSLKMAMLGGVRLEDKKENGITTLLSNTWAAGAGPYSEEAIAKIVEGSTGYFSCFGGRNSTGLNMDILAPYFDQIKDVFKELVLNPNFEQTFVEREAKLQIEQIKTRHDNPSSVAIQKFMENIFSGHPYSMDVLGNEEFLKRAESAQVKNFFKKMNHAQNATFVAVGDFNQDKMISYIEELSSSMGQGEKFDQKIKAEDLLKEKNVFVPLEKEQAHIVYGFRGLTLTDEKRYALQLIQAILAGQGGRLFLELRDKASLAYTVAPIHMDGVDAGYFGAYIGCSPEKTDKAIEMLKQEFNKIANQAPSQIEVDRAKKYLIGQNHIGLQRNSAQASSILFDEIYGIDSNEAFHFSDHIKNVTSQSISQLAGDLFLKPAATIVVGPTKPKGEF